MKVLVLTRRFVYKYNSKIAKSLFDDGTEFVFISDERLPYVGVKWWGKYFYHFKYSDDLLDEFYSKNIDFDDVIQRCRQLRALPKFKAYDYIRRAILSWRQILLDIKPDFVLSLPIDSYIIHSLYIVCDRLKIPSVDVQYTQFPNRIRFTRFGELLSNYDEGDTGEFKSFLNNLERPFRPNYISNVKKNFLLLGVRRLIIDSLKRYVYASYRWLTQDSDSFSFSGWVYQKLLMISTPARLRAIRSTDQHAVNISECENYIFLPLQFYPESVNDYWIKNRALIDHHEVTLRVISDISKKYKVIVKEHPTCYGKRDEYFINRLKAMKNVSFCRTDESIYGVINKSLAVVGYASTTLMQSIILKKPVLFLGESYYGTGGYPVVKKFSEIMFDLDKSIGMDVSIAREKFIQELRLYYDSTYFGKIGDFTPIGESSQLENNFYFSEPARKFIKGISADDCIAAMLDFKNNH